MPAEKYAYKTLAIGNKKILFFFSPNHNVWYRGQDIGLFLGFTADGRNLTRNVRSRWPLDLEEGVHWQVRERRSIWFSSRGLYVLFDLVLRDDWDGKHKLVRRLLRETSAIEDYASGLLFGEP